MRKRDYAFLTGYASATERMTSKNQRTVYLSLLALITHATAPQDLRGYWTKVTIYVAIVIFSSTVLNQQSALRSVHPLSNDKGNI